MTDISGVFVHVYLNEDVVPGSKSTNSSWSEYNAAPGNSAELIKGTCGVPGVFVLIRACHWFAVYSQVFVSSFFYFTLSAAVSHLAVSDRLIDCFFKSENVVNRSWIRRLKRQINAAGWNRRSVLLLLVPGSHERKKRVQHDGRMDPFRYFSGWSEIRALLSALETSRTKNR